MALASELLPPASVQRRRTIVVGVLGCGTVGGGVVERLLADGAVLGSPVRVAAVLVRDLAKPRHPAAVAPLLTGEPAAAVDDPAIDIVVETIGGTEAAYELVARALRHGKHVITANKSLVAAYGQRLAQLAHDHHAAFRYEAAVGGAIPVVRAVGEFMAAEPIEEIAGVVNGTSNFLFEGMAAGGAFADVVRQAQEAGYAEPDPANDVDGIDAAQKLAVLIALGLRVFVGADRIPRRTLRELEPADFAFAQRQGLALVPLAIARPREGGVEALVSPAYVRAGHDFARAAGPGNVIRVTGRHSGPLQFSGRGAGREATASAVLGDIADVVRRLAKWEHQRVERLERAPFAPREPVLPHVARLTSGESAFLPPSTRREAEAALRAGGIAAASLYPAFETEVA